MSIAIVLRVLFGEHQCIAPPPKVPKHCVMMEIHQREPWPVGFLVSPTSLSGASTAYVLATFSFVPF